jgi:predicted nucleic acid-binding protein
MRIVADTSILLAVALEEPERDVIIKLTQEAQLIAPEVLPFEVGNALSSLFRRNLLGEDRVLQVWEYIQRIPIDLRTVDIQHSLQIAMRYRIYAYDAYFLSCAWTLRVPLMSLDRKMVSVAKQSGIKVLEVA